jgi:hypothetical protein
MQQVWWNAGLLNCNTMRNDKKRYYKNLMDHIRHYFKRNKFLIAADVLLVLAVAATLTHILIQRRSVGATDAAICTSTAKRFELTVKDDKFSQPNLAVHLCDTIAITDLDASNQYYLNFGEHENHISYPGYTPLVQGPNETVNIDAFQQGSFEVHDHIRDKAVLELTVGPKQ